MVEAALIPGLVGAMEAAGAGTAAKGTLDMMNSGKGKTRVLGDGLSDSLSMGSSSGEIPKEALDKINSALWGLVLPGSKTFTKIFHSYLANNPDALTSKKGAKSKKDFKAPKEIQDVIDSGSHLSISGHSDKDGLLTTLGMAGLGSPEIRKISSTGKIPSEVLKKMPPELMKDLAAGLGIAQGSKTTSIPVSEKDIGSDYNLVSGRDIARQVRGSESYSAMMSPYDPQNDDDEEEKKDKQDKKRELNRKVDDASEKYADAMNEKITKNSAEQLTEVAKNGQRLDIKPNALKDLINKGGRFAHDWRQAESVLRKAGLAPLIDKLYDGTYTAEEMQQLEEAVSNLASIAKDVLMH